MVAFWYAAVSLMLTVYVVLDGFDLGAGIVHLVVARSDRERREALAAIGPAWNGNEVWLVAGAGVLAFAFPRAFAAGFSGLYLPLVALVWLLVVRGLAIEVRSHLRHPLWRGFWDAAFGLASAATVVLLGVALGNVLRGVALDETGYFPPALFTELLPGRRPGALDAYTLLVGACALAALAAHGAVFLAARTEGRIRARARAAAGWAWAAAAPLAIACAAATGKLRPEIYANLAARPWSWPLPAVATAGVAGALLSLRRGRDRAAFACSTAVLAATLGGTAAGLFPTLLPSTLAPAHALDAANAAAGEHALRGGVIWWTAGMSLAVAYSALALRRLAGRVDVDAAEAGSR